MIHTRLTHEYALTVPFVSAGMGFLSLPPCREYQRTCWDLDPANGQFEQLCDRFATANPTWIAELRKKREHYLAFLNPEYMRKSFSTTNIVEAINGQLEIMRRNSGGYFHSEDTLKFKLCLAIASLENGKWRVANHRIHSVLPQLNAMFQSRFEGIA